MYKSWLFENINKIKKCLARLIRKSREECPTQYNQNEKEIAFNATELQRVIRLCYEQLHTNKMDNVEEAEKFLKRNSLPGLSQEDRKCEETNYQY